MQAIQIIDIWQKLNHLTEIKISKIMKKCNKIILSLSVTYAGNVYEFLFNEESAYSIWGIGDSNKQVDNIQEII